MKKLLKIAGISVAVIAVAALLATGILMLVRYNNVVRTGNVLGVSWYSEGEKEFTISTVEQLDEFVELSNFYTFEGQTIKLGADLELNKGNAEDWKENAPKKRWKPIYDFNGTFDGQGHTIKGLYGKAYESPMALFVDTGDSCVVRNIKLVNGYMTTRGRSGTASFVVNGAGTFEKLYSDVIIDHNGDRAAGIASRNNNSLTLNECWYDGTLNITLLYAGGIIDEVTKGNTIINHCLFSGTINSTHKTADDAAVYVGGICGRVAPLSTVHSTTGVTINDCLSSGTINTTTQKNAGSVLGYVAYGGLARASFKDAYAAARIADQTYASTTGSITGKAIAMRDKELTGIKAYQWTTLNFDRYWAPVEGSTPVLRCFAENPMSIEGVEKEYDTSWYVPGEYYFEIHDRKDLYGLALLSANTNYKDVQIVLKNDIVLNEGKAKDWAKNEPELPWFPIFDFNGIFNGKGHTVSGIYLKNANQYQGFFTTVQANGVIKDLSIKNSYFCNTNETLSMIGTIAGDFRGKMEGIYSNAIVEAHGPQVGGLIARANDNDDPGTDVADKIVMSNCWFDGEVISKGEISTYAAGLVSAVIQGDLVVEHCLNTGTIRSECKGRAIHVAGLVGSVSHVEARLVIKDSLNAGVIDAAYDVGVGSVIGRLSQEKHSANISDTYTLEESHIKSIGTSSGTIKGGSIRLPKSILTGKSAYRFSTLDYEKYWTTTANGTPVLRKFATAVQSNAGMSKAIDISWYKDDAKSFTLKNLKQFYGFAFLATGNDFEGKTVKLGTNITVNTPNVAAWKAGTARGGNPWVSIGNQGMEFNGTFDGQGHVIRGIYVKSDTQYTGLFGRANSDSVIKNFKLTDSYFCNTNKELCMTGSVAGEIRGRMENVYSNAVVVGYGPQIGGMVARSNDYDDYKRQTKAEIADKTVVKNCWFDGEVRLVGSQNTYAGGVVGALIQGDLEMTDCLNSGTVISEKNDISNGSTLHVGGVLGSQSHAESRLVMKNCLNVGKIVTEPGMGTAAGAVLGRVSGKNHTATITNVFATKESYSNVIGWSNGIVNGKSYVDAGANNPAGTSVNRTNLILRTDAEVKAFFGPTTKAWTCDTINNGVDRGTPILKYFASWWKGQQPATKEASDTSWYNTTDKEFEISTPEQFNGLAELSAKYNFAGQTFKLAADIQMNPVDDATLKAWEKGTKTPSNLSYPIGSAAVPFAGTFDGQGHTISGLYMSTNAEGAGLFGVTDKTATFKDFRLVDSFLSSNGTKFGGIVGAGALASMENIYVNAIVKTTASYAGGFVGQIDPSEGTTQISNCWFDGEMIQVGGKVHSVGGFIGNDAHATPMIFKNCLMTGKVSGGYRVGGFYGWRNNYAVLEFHNCLSVGTVASNPDEAYVEYEEEGGYIGHFNTSSYNMKYFNSYSSYDKMIGVYKNAGEAAAIEVSAYLKDRETLIETGEKTLFPALSGEQQNAWVNDIGFNNTDRGTPILEYFADAWFAENEDSSLEAMPETKADTEWYNETDTSFTIYTPEELLGLAEIVNSGEDSFVGKTVKLGKDIVINEVDDTILAKWKAGTQVPEVEWISIGTASKPFGGVFDGQGHSISGLYLDAKTEGAGLFGYTAETSEFKNFKFIDSYLKSNSPSLGMIGVGKFTNIENIYTNATFESSAPQVGGFVGVICNYKPDYAAIYSTIKNCWFDGTVTQTDGSKYATGGFVGGTNGAATLGFYNCLSTGTVTGGFRTGGFYGWRNYYALIELRNCLSVADVSTNVASGYESYAHLAGSFFGDFSSNTYNANMYNSYGVGDKINGSLDWPKFETTDYIKTRTYLIETGEKKLFPALAGEGKNAWVNDIGYNDADRGTPILETFADWWLAENPSSGLEEMPGIKADTSWYSDAGTEFTISTLQQLLGFAQLTAEGKSFAGQTVKLGADITVNDVNDEVFATWVSGTDVAEIEWSPIGTSGTPFAGTFDGQGHTIRGLYLNSTTGYTGFFGKVAYPAEIKNFKLVDSYMKSTGSGLGVIGEGTPKLVDSIYSNATMVGASATGGIIGGFTGIYSPYSAATADNWAKHQVINNCWFDGDITATGGCNSYGGIVGTVSNYAYYEIANCLFTGSISGSSDNVGGLLGFSNWASKFEIKNTLVLGSVEMSGGYNHGSMLGKIASTYFMTFKDVYATGTTIAGTGSKADVVTAAAALATDRMDLIEADEAELFEALGNETENAWVNDIGYNATDRGTPILATFAEWWLDQNPDSGLTERPSKDPNKVKPDTEWYKDSETTFTLLDAADLLGFAQLASEGKTFAGKTVKLGADIALNEVDAAILATWVDGSVTPSNVWTPVGTSTNKFAGTFDGQGHTISGLYLNSTEVGAGLFGYTATTAVFKNFKFVDSYITSTRDAVGMIGYGSFELMENVYTNAIIKTTGQKAGGFVGIIVPRGTAQNTQSNIAFKNCWFDGTVEAKSVNVGGFVGAEESAAGILFANCLSTGDVKAAYRAGGFYGWKNAYAWHEFRNCLSVAHITVTNTSTYAGYWGAYYGDHNTSTYNLKPYNSYGVVKNVGHYSSGTAFEGATYVKTRDYLVEADETEIFPVLTGETENAWVQDPYWNDSDRGTPILATFAEWWLARQTQSVSQRVDTKWHNTTDTTFTLTTPQQLLGLAEIVNSGKDTFAGKTVKLGANIALNEVNETILQAWKAGTQVPASTWTPVGTSTNKFAGTFDGQGYTISGLYLNSTEVGAGLFGYTATTAVFKNFKFVDSYIASTRDAVGMIGYGSFELMENVYTNAIIKTTGQKAGGFVGIIVPRGTAQNTQSNIAFKNCWFDGTVETGSVNAGGFVGAEESAAGILFANCLSTGDVKAAYRAGGFYGWKNAYAWHEFRNCLSVAHITVTNTSTYAGYWGAYYGDHNTSTYNLKPYNSYGVVKNVGHYSSGTAFEGATYVKTRDYLVEADETEIFPVLTGETVNAWEQDPYFNASDRGTPILASFAEWWLDRQPTDGLSERVDKEWYKESETEFTLTKTSEFLGFAELAKTNTFAGKTVKLGADIVLNKVDEDILKAWVDGTKVAKNQWTPIGTSTSKFAGTFDGQGHTISGLYLNSTEVGAGLFGYTATTAVFKNFKFVDSYITSTRDAVGMIGYGSFELMENVYTNAIIKTTGQKAGGFVGIIVPRGTAQNTQSNIAFKNCWFDGTVEAKSVNVGGFVGAEESAAGILFANCLSTGDVKAAYRAGGFYGWKNAYAWHEFCNCLSVAHITVTNTSTYAGYWGSYYGDHNTSTYNLKTYNSYGVVKNVGHYSSGTAFEGDTYVKTRDFLVNANEETLFPKLTGETANAWVVDTSFNATDRGTPILATFAEWWLERQPEDEATEKVDKSWFTGNSSTYTLKTAAELMGLAELAQTNDFKGITIKLGADITLNDVNATTLAAWKAGTQTPGRVWTPLGSASKPFAGKFDGQGHTIKGLYVSATTDSVGMFGTVVTGVEIEDFKLVDSYIKGAGKVGLVGNGTVTRIEKVYTNAIIESTSNMAGGFLGYYKGAYTDKAVGASENWANGRIAIKNCWFAGEVNMLGTAYGASGFVGGHDQRGAVDLSDCLFSGKVTGARGDYARLGTFFGWLNNTAEYTFTNCLAVGTIESPSTSYVGGFIGNTGTTSATFTNCYTTISPLVGTGSDQTYISSSVKTVNELQNTSVSTLFTSDAWKAVTGSTPVLKAFDK